MALKAGRKGLLSKLVDARGRLKAGAGGITPEQAAKIDRALLTPVSTLTEKQLAGVGTGKEQIMTKVGNGLKLSGSTSPFTLGIDAPEFSASDAGKALTVGADGTLEWQTRGGGGGIELAGFLSGLVPAGNTQSPTGKWIGSATAGSIVYPCEGGKSYMVGFDIPESTDTSFTSKIIGVCKTYPELYTPVYNAETYNMTKKGHAIIVRVPDDIESGYIVCPVNGNSIADMLIGCISLSVNE